MAVVDSPAHLLSLKVMRISRPEVTSAWQPFFSSSPHYSAHASASILSLQGNAPLPGHPKTLRDLTHASELLTLPSSFGSIQLGQTFSSCLCTNNEAPFSVDSISIRVEMQTITSKTLLFHTPEPSGRTLAPGDTLESVVSHEIKELGQHVLACVVKYRLPPNVRPIPGASEDLNDPGIQTFRKFYKFIVTNPLAVKTKVHPVRSPTALLSPSEREKIFLEVHIQNVTQETMFFEHLTFEPTDDWQVQDPNVVGSNQSIFSGSLALMSPQDIRQYIFILSPTSISALRPLAVHPPGSIFPLGRLNISWRSSYGEPGRLLTSMLTRRIPLINPGPPAVIPQPQPIQQQHSHPVSAVPPYLKRERERVTVPIPSRPQSPTVHSQSRPSTPPLRRPQSPVPIQAQQASTMPTPIPIADAHLTLRESLPSPIRVGELFILKFTLHICKKAASADCPLLFGIQHILPPGSAAPVALAPPRVPTTNVSSGPIRTGTGHNTPRTILSPTSTVAPTQSLARPLSSQTTAQRPDFASPRASHSLLSSGFSTPTATSSRGTPANPASPGSFNYNLARQKLLTASPRQQNKDFYTMHDGGEGEIDHSRESHEEGDRGGVVYPPPYPLNPSTTPDTRGGLTGLVVPTGASSFSLPPITLVQHFIPPHPASAPPSGSAVHVSHSSASTIDSMDSQVTEEAQDEQHLYGSNDFELTYVPLRTGFHSVGGIRLLYLGEGEEVTESRAREHTGLEIQIEKEVRGERRNALIMKEYDIVAEILVSP